MCLPNFVEFKQIEESNPVIGYRSWKIWIENPYILRSESRNYNQAKVIEGPHEVLENNSGIYSYNNNNYNYYNNYNNNNNNYNYYYSYNNNYNYYIGGIIHQYGKVAFHETGYRSEYAKVITLFTIRELDATGPPEFLGWIKKFNIIIKTLAEKYQANTIHYQDFIEGQK